MYKNLQPCGGENGFTRGRLRLVKSLFGCGYILTGTHPLIVERENTVTSFAKTLVNCAIQTGDLDEALLPVVTCNRAVATLRVPEFFDAEDLGVAPARSCKRCRGCHDCSFRNVMISREKELVVRKVEDQIVYDNEKKSVKVSYPWNEDVFKLGDNLRQAVKVQGSIERRLIRDKAHLEAYNSEFKKFIDRGAISRITQQETDE